MQTEMVTLAVADPGDYAAFKRELQEAFAIAVVEEFDPPPEGPIPSDADLDASMHGRGAVVLRVLCDGRKVGGAVVSIDEASGCNELELFFISPQQHGRGLGLRAWKAIERMFPATRVWATHTPYFEKRNIHFYVNKCGFKIVEFFCERHQDQHRPGPSDLPGPDEGFRFEKVMERGA